jgi:AcrR family transcriptional regulator
MTSTKAPSGVDRRVRKTQQAIRDAFIGLVLDRGYENVTVEDITERADVARATFYLHYADKATLLEVLFEEMTAEVTERLTTGVTGAPENPRTRIVGALYGHAETYRDLYLLCLRGSGHGRARAAYLDVVAEGCQKLFAERLRASGKEPLVPVEVISRAYAGAHVALLEAWLEQEDRDPPEVMAGRQTELLGNGLMWAMQGLSEELMRQFPTPEGKAPHDDPAGRSDRADSP